MDDDLAEAIQKQVNSVSSLAEDPGATQAEIDETPSNIDWGLKIIGMDDDLAEAIQKQVNSVSSLAEDPGATQAEIDEDLRMREEEAALFSE